MVSLPVAGGGEVVAKNCNKVTAKVFEGNEVVQKTIKAERFIYGNKQVGDVVGTVEYWYGSYKISESPLILEQGIEVPVKKELFITGIIRFFRRLLLKKD